MKLSALKQETGSLGLVALDEAYALADLLGLSLSEPSHEQLLIQVLTELVKVHSQQAAGVILDPIYSLQLLEEGSQLAGALVRLEQMQPPDPLATPKFIPSFGVENIRNMYGLAKLELFYHPTEEKALEKKQLVAEIFDFCQYEEIDFLLKLMIYNPLGGKLKPDEFQTAQLEVVSELQRLANVLALQYPQDPLAAATLTSNLDIPWLVAGDKQDYEQFKNDARVSLENGAAGFLAGELLWREIGEMRLADHSPDKEAILKFIQTTNQDRIIELMRITKEAAAEA
jgi:tagatose-1,6-bisphosphate aldolase